MLSRTSRVGAMLTMSLIASIVCTGIESTAVYGADNKDSFDQLPAGSEPGMLYIRFKDTITPAEGMARLSHSNSPDYLPALDGAQWDRSTGDLKQSDVAAMHAKAEKKLGRDLPNPWQGVYVNLKKGVDAAEAIAGVRETGFAVQALHVPMVMSMPLMNAGDFQDHQEYLNPAEDDGIGAQHIWEQFGVTGEGVSVCDIEYNYDPLHCDLPEIEALGSLVPHPRGPHHGTAAIGCVAALNDGSGTTGIAHGVDRVFFSPCVEIIEHNGEETSRTIIDRAILQAVLNMNAGDVLFLEVGLYGPNWNGNLNTQRGTVPVEWYPPFYDAIVIAVANDIIVIEPAANGAENLDDPIYSEDNYGHWPFLLENDSGAIMVGAGRSTGRYARERSWFSNYGATVDVQGWGGGVMTTGYGYFSNNDENCNYTNSFNGTSSASAVVAGAAVLLQSYIKNRWNSTLTPAEMKWILRETGQPQRAYAGMIKNIGPLPDLVAATEFYETLTPLHRVPEDHGTIQEAVDAAGNGDTILVGPGAWAGFDVDRKSLLIQSTHGPDVTSIDGAGVSSCIRCLDSSIEIDGFTVRDCRAPDGAGLYADGDRLTVRRCVFRNNLATVSGGGIWSSCDQIRIAGCEFVSNRAWFAGAGIHVLGPAAEITDSSFRDNSADNGGGICTRAERCWIVNNVFENNDARFTGGGVDLWQGLVDVMECRFEGNASNRGGGLAMSQGASGTISDCLFEENRANLEGAGCWVQQASAWFMECRFSGNIAVNSGGGIQSESLDSLEIKSSILCGNLPTAVDGDFLDAGENCFANDCQDGNNNGRPDECDLVEGDVDGDGDVDIEDLLSIISAYGPCMGCAEDVNGDGMVDVEDLLAVLACWQGDC